MERDDNTTLPDGYRLTELGPLPQEWQVVRLGEVFSLVPKKQRELRIQDEAEYRLLTVRLYAKGIVMRSEQAGSQIGTKVLYRTEDGDFVFSKIDARNGAWGFVGKDLSGALVSGDFPILKLERRKSNEDFISLLLSRSVFWEQLKNFAVGTTNRRRIQPSQLLSLPIPLPPLAEQRAIAQVLRTIQRAKEAGERVVAALKELKKSLMRHLFTYGPVGVRITTETTENTEPFSVNSVPSVVNLKDTELGPIPAHWQVVRLGEVSETKSGGTPDRKRAEYFGGPILWVKSGELKDNTVEHTEERLTEMGLLNSSAKVFPKGTLLVAMYGATAGKVGILKADAATNQATCAIFPFETLLSEYLFYVFIYRRDELLNERYGGAQPNISQTVLKNFPIPLPPLEEQREIARILQAVDRRIAAEEAWVRAVEDLFRSLLHELMSGKRRVPAEWRISFESESKI